jgi:hypothetical protein
MGLGLLRSLSVPGCCLDVVEGEVVRDFRFVPILGLSASLMTRACSKAFHALISSCDSSSGTCCLAAVEVAGGAISRNRFAADGPAVLAAT